MTMGEGPKDASPIGLSSAHGPSKRPQAPGPRSGFGDLLQRARSPKGIQASQGRGSGSLPVVSRMRGSASRTSRPFRGRVGVVPTPFDRFGSRVRSLSGAVRPIPSPGGRGPGWDRTCAQRRSVPEDGPSAARRYTAPRGGFALAVGSDFAHPSHSLGMGEAHPPADAPRHLKRIRGCGSNAAFSHRSGVSPIRTTWTVWKLPVPGKRTNYPRLFNGCSEFPLARAIPRTPLPETSLLHPGIDPLEGVNKHWPDRPPQESPGTPINR